MGVEKASKLLFVVCGFPLDLAMIASITIPYKMMLFNDRANLKRRHKNSANELMNRFVPFFVLLSEM